MQPTLRINIKERGVVSRAVLFDVKSKMLKETSKRETKISNIIPPKHTHSQTHTMRCIN